MNSGEEITEGSVRGKGEQKYRSGIVVVFVVSLGDCLYNWVRVFVVKQGQ